MSREPNPFAYADPTASIADGLVRAIFGDPDLAEKQRAARAQEDLRRAQEEEARAHAGYYTSQTVGQDGQNVGSAGLPGLFKSFLDASVPPPMTPETTPIASVSDPRFLSDMGQPMPEAPVVDTDAQRNALGALLGSMAQAQGDKLNVSDLAGVMGAFGGGDEMARRGMVAQGQSPSKDFAITPDRADDIAQAGYAAELAKALGVAEINNRDDIPVAQINRASAFDVAGVNNRDDVSVALINNRDDVPVAEIKAYGAAPGYDAIQRALPGAPAIPNSGPRTAQHNKDVGGVGNSYHLGTHAGAMAYDIPRQPGLTVQQAAAKIMTANPGVRVVEALDEGDHWHFALQSSGTGAKASVPKPYAVTRADLTMFDGPLDENGDRNGGEIDKWLTSHGFTSDPVTAEGRKVKQALRTRAVAIFQRTGNPLEAVDAAATELKVFSRAQRDAAKAKPKSAKPKAAAPAKATPTATGPNGEKVIWNGKAWVPKK